MNKLKPKIKVYIIMDSAHKKKLFTTSPTTGNKTNIKLAFLTILLKPFLSTLTSPLRALSYYYLFLFKIAFC